jgi:hypothetical protein
MSKQCKCKRVPAEKFVAVWQRSINIEQVAQKTGMKYLTVLQRGSILRRAGVHLKKLDRKKSTAGLDIALLNKIAKAALKTR